MRRVHPLWRGFWLACVLAAALVLLGPGGLDWTAAFRGERRALALGLMAAAGAFIAALPGRLLRWRWRATRPSRPWKECWPGCLAAFLCGVGMMMGCGMAGSGRILPALLEGSTGAFAFAGAALTSGFVAARIAGRRAAP